MERAESYNYGKMKATGIFRLNSQTPHTRRISMHSDSRSCPSAAQQSLVARCQPWNGLCSRRSWRSTLHDVAARIPRACPSLEVLIGRRSLLGRSVELRHLIHVAKGPYSRFSSIAQRLACQTLPYSYPSNDPMSNIGTALDID